MKILVAACLLLAVVAAPVAAQTYGVTVTADKTTDFTRFKTYAWDSGWPALNEAVRTQIVAAVDRELAALGFQKKDAGPSDVLVTYATVWRTDVDLTSKAARDKKAGGDQQQVGTLVVIMMEPGTRKQIFRARGDKPIEIDPAKIKPVVDGTVAEMFAKYPTRLRK